MAQNRVLGNTFVKYGAHARPILGESTKMKLEEQLKNAIRLKHFSLRTEESYVGWYRRFVLWHGKRHPAEMGAAEVEAFLTHLAVNRGLAAVSQNQDLNLETEMTAYGTRGINGKSERSA